MKNGFDEAGQSTVTFGDLLKANVLGDMITSGIKAIGSAIKGAIRADIFWGGGERAFSKAGRQHSNGSYYIFLPKEGKSFAIKK